MRGFTEIEREREGRQGVNRAFMVIVKSGKIADKPQVAHMARLTGILYHETTRCTAIPPGWDATPLQGFPHILLPVHYLVVVMVVVVCVEKEFFYWNKSSANNVLAKNGTVL